GMELNGRWYERDHDERGMRFSAARLDKGRAQLLAVYPQNLKAGEQGEITLVGSGLEGTVDLGDGVVVERVLSRSDSHLTVQARAKTDAQTASTVVRVGNIEGGAEGRFGVYQQLDQITVEPPFTIARVGGNGGSTPKVQARFEAVGWGAGADGKAGTADDIRLGYLPAQWTVEPFDAAAKADRDVEFAGRMDMRTGVFTPGAAGPNPARRMSTNNAGNLKVVAQVADGEQQLQGDGQLIVTVQRWNNAPLP
ncbi:MAG: quinohemoprotein amine dehydrogenase subunit alpha, partial [Porticoccaceae bacterium]|nr:quinohemoprotein amine dehydrogenase subunit alpha [Porticoccaceae bacterium]